MPTAVDSLVAVTPGGAVTEDMIVGWIFYYSIPDEYKPATTIQRAMKAADLPEEWAPRARQKVHVFQEACRSAEGSRSNGKRREVVVNEVTNNNTKCAYQVTLRTWDDENEVIEHEKSMRVTFDKAKGNIDKFEPLDAEAFHELEGLVDEIREHFDSHAARIPGHKIRTIIRQQLEKAGAENMSDSGRSAIYFIENAKRPLLDSVAKFLSTLYTGKGGHTRGSLHSIPMVNDEGQREMLKRKFVENCDEDLKQYRNMLLDLVKGQNERQRGYRADLLNNLQRRRRELTERVERFQGILNDSMAELDQSQELADKALAKLLREAEVE